MGLDSVDIIRKMEQALAIHIPNKEAAGIVTVQDIYDVAWNNITNKQQTNREAVEATIRAIVASVAGLGLHEIEPHHKLADDLGID